MIKQIKTQNLKILTFLIKHRLNMICFLSIYYFSSIFDALNTNSTTMDFNFTEEQLMIQQAARDFAVAELLPGVIERDEHSKFPTEQVKKMAELGFIRKSRLFR